MILDPHTALSARWRGEAQTLGSTNQDREYVGAALAAERCKQLRQCAEDLDAVHGAHVDNQARLVEALFAAIDVVKVHVGGFPEWPVELKDAFSKAIIDPSPATPEEIRRTQELAKRLGWKRTEASS